jgi:DnaJ-class molecular chaperone
MKQHTHYQVLEIKIRALQDDIKQADKDLA